MADKYLEIIDLFEKKVTFWQNRHSDLKESIIKINAAEKKRTKYEILNSVVFNQDLRKIKKNGPKYILVADNPGMDEQKNSRYLTGLSGKMARNFFENNGLVWSFENEVAVFNKSCIHTHSTKDLKKLKKYKELFDESQIFMADILVDVQKIFNCDVWIVGCSELKRKGLFETYLERLKKRYSGDAEYLRDKVFFYPHFSYGNFNRNLNAVMKKEPDLEIKEALRKAGEKIL